MRSRIAELRISLGWPAGRWRRTPPQALPMRAGLAGRRACWNRSRGWKKWGPVPAWGLFWRPPGRGGWLRVSGTPGTSGLGTSGISGLGAHQPLCVGVASGMQIVSVIFIVHQISLRGQLFVGTVSYRVQVAITAGMTTANARRPFQLVGL